MMPLHVDPDHCAQMPDTDPRRESVFAALKELGGEATCGQIAQATRLHPSSVRNALDKLQWQKLVERDGMKASTSRHPVLFRLTQPETQTPALPHAAVAPPLHTRGK